MEENTAKITEIARRDEVFGDRCVLVTNGNLTSMIALSGWLKSHGEKILKIYVTYKLPSSKNNMAGALGLLSGSGAGYFWMKLLLNKFLPVWVRLSGAGASVSDYVEHLGLSIPVESVDSVNTPEFLQELAELRPKCLVSFSATQRFSKKMIESFPAGAVNVHYGALPRYAGLSPYFWHLYHREDKFGVTLHRIEEKLDAGGIISQVERPTPKSRDALDLLLDMSEQVSPLLNDLFDGEKSLKDAYPQDLTARSYFKHPSRSEMALYKESGCTLTTRESIGRLRRVVRTIME